MEGREDGWEGGEGKRATRGLEGCEVKVMLDDFFFIIQIMRR